MGNEVEIVVTSDDRTTPGYASARAKGEAYGKDTERSISAAGKRAGEKFGTALNAGVAKGAKDSAKDVESSLKRVDSAITETTQMIRSLGQEFIKTNDIEVFRKLRDTRGILSNLKQMKKELTATGVEGGEALGDGIEEGTSNKIPNVGKVIKSKLKPALIGIGTAVGIALVGEIGSALTGAAGIGAIGLGVGLAALRPEVQLAAKDWASTIKDELASDAEPMIKPLKSAFRSLGKDFETIRPSIRGMLKDVAPLTDTLVKGIGNFFKNLMPGIREMVSKSGPIIDIMSEGMSQLGRDTSTALKLISGGSNDAAEGLKDLINFSGDLIVTLGGVIRGAEEANRVFHKWSGLGLIEKGVKAASNALGGDFVPSSSTAADHAKTAGREFNRAARELHGLSAATLEYSTATLAAADGELAFHQAILDAKRALKDNGKTLDENTEKGIANRGALLQIANSAVGAASKLQALGTNQAGVTKRLQDGYTAFVASARAMGMSKREADRLARSYGLIPRSKKTNISAPGAKKSLRDIEALRWEIARLHGKDIFITTNYVVKGSSGVNRPGQRAVATGGLIGAAQAGGTHSNWTMVGEHGPELAELPVGTRVRSNPDTQSMFARMSNRNEPIIIRFESGGGRLENLFLEVMRSITKAKGGGNVQLAFGKGK